MLRRRWNATSDTTQFVSNLRIPDPYRCHIFIIYPTRQGQNTIGRMGKTSRYAVRFGDLRYAVGGWSIERVPLRSGGSRDLGVSTRRNPAGASLAGAAQNPVDFSKIIAFERVQSER